MIPTSSSFIETLAFSSPPIPTVDHAKLLQELDLWTNAQFTVDMTTKVPDQNQITIPLQDQSATTDEFLLKFFSLEQQSIPTGTQEQQEQRISTIQPRTILPKALSFDEETGSDSSTPTTPHTALGGMNDFRKRTRSIEDDVGTADEDKRRRNTAASARFRAKKKLREHAMETAVKEMTSKSNKLEVRVEELERELRWLRSLLVGGKNHNTDGEEEGDSA